MSRIGVDTFSFDRPGENYGVGPGVYVWHLLERLVEIGRNHEFIVFTNRENESFVPRAPNVEMVRSPIPNRPRLFRPLHEQVVVPILAKKLHLDIVHSLGNTISFLIASRSILTVYDLMWKYYLSRGTKSLKYRYFAMIVPPSLRRARALIAISEFVANEVQEAFGIDADRITTIPLAPGRVHEVDAIAREAFKERFNFPFILSVTTSFPHKNLVTLIKAFSELKNRGTYGGRLLVAGQLKGPYLKEVLAAAHVADQTKDIQLLGFVDESTKALLYCSADLLVYPSLYEGFGLPVLEAMQYGTAVLCARAASLPEVGANACAYFDPRSVSDLVTALEHTLRDPSIRTKLVELGSTRASEFSWDLTARRTLEVYDWMLGWRNHEHGMTGG
jgi:glycosyltransferase involved in cell wall biosynthesis